MINEPTNIHIVKVAILSKLSSNLNLRKRNYGKGVCVCLFRLWTYQRHTHWTQ